MGKIDPRHQHRRERRDRRTASRSRCSRSRCPRPSSPTASSPPRPRCRATSCARAGSRPTAGRRSCAPSRSSPRRRSTSTTRATSACSRCAPRRAACTPRHGGLGLMIVDYLQLIRPDGRADSRVEQVGQISRGLKILARELEIPVIAVSQLSRAVESRHPPIADALRPARERPDRAGRRRRHVRLPRGVLRPASPSASGEADIIFAKHRNGPVGEVTLTFQPKLPALRQPLPRPRRGSRRAAERNGTG